MSRPEDGALPGDPFWDVVQRRHPDVDVVILPPEPAVAERRPVVYDDEARRTAHEVGHLFDELWLELLPGRPPTAAVRWEGAPGAAVAVRAATVDVAGDVVDRAEATLVARAWRVTAPGGGLQRVTATSGGSTVTVSAHDGTCRLEVRGPELAVDRSMLRRLRQAADA